MFGFFERRMLYRINSVCYVWVISKKDAIESIVYVMFGFFERNEIL
jgi:hypothetical protein